MYAAIKGPADSYAGKFGLGVKHSSIWTTDKELDKLFKVIPERYQKSFQLTRMAINSLLLPHVDNDFKTTINFYIEPNDYKTIFWKPKDGVSSWRAEEKQDTAVDTIPLKDEDIDPDELKERIKEYVKDGQNMPTCEEISYVDAVYTFEDVYEIGCFVAQPNEAYLLDVGIPHNVEPLSGTRLRKALSLRTKDYTFGEVYEMLQETGNL